MIQLNIDKSKLILYNNDCFEILKNIKNETIDLVITDPPYGIGAGNKFHNQNEQNWDTFENADFYHFTVKWLKECYRILKPEGTCWFFFGPTKIYDILKAVESSGFTNHLENWAIYARESGRGTTKKLKSLREDIFHLTKNPEKYVWNSVEWLRKVIAPYKMAGGIKRGWEYGPDGKTPLRFTSLGNIMAFSSECQFEETAQKKGTVCDIASGLPLKFDGYPSDVTFFVNPSYNNKFDKAIHSCQKPILLLSMLTMLSSLEGNTVLDPFMGSGSGAVASILCNRNFIGIEQESDTYNSAIEWIKNFPYHTAEKYIKAHTSSAEPKFKFGQDTRAVCAKPIK